MYFCSIKIRHAFNRLQKRRCVFCDYSDIWELISTILFVIEILKITIAIHSFVVGMVYHISGPSEILNKYSIFNILFYLFYLYRGRQGLRSFTCYAHAPYWTIANKQWFEVGLCFFIIYTPHFTILCVIFTFGRISVCAVSA